MKLWLTLVPALAGCMLLSACGRPPGAAGGPPEGDFPVSAVVAPAQSGVVDETVSLVASMEAQDAVTLVSELDVPVVEVRVQEGRAVTNGALLIKLDDTQTAANLAEARASFKLAELTYRRNKDLLANATISQEEMDSSEAEFHRALAARTVAIDQQAKTAVRAPFDGVVAERHVSTGQFVARGTALTEVIRMDPLELVCDAPERHLARLRVGMPIAFSSSAYPGETFEGTVTYVSPRVDESTRTIRVKALVPNADGRLKPGMFGRVSIVVNRQEGGITIPEAAVKFNDGATLVVAVGKDGRTAFRPVQLGARTEGRVTVLEGLAEGDHVLVEGHQKVGPGMLVIAAEESTRYGVQPGPMGPMPAPADGASE